MKRLAGLLCAFVLSGSVLADGGPPWGRSIAEGFDLPRPYGIGFDYFSMDQDYQIRSLQFNLPGVPPIPPELVSVDNDVDHRDLKFDVWVLPFLNLFAVYGHVNARTDVDLTAVPTIGGFWISWLPFALPQRWPFCWWVAVAVDHFSRRALDRATFKNEPSAVEVTKFLKRIGREVSRWPGHIISDHGPQASASAPSASTAASRWSSDSSSR